MDYRHKPSREGQDWTRKGVGIGSDLTLRQTLDFDDAAFWDFTLTRHRSSGSALRLRIQPKVWMTGALIS
jgi:hypothetical protein